MILIFLKKECLNITLAISLRGLLIDLICTDGEP